MILPILTIPKDERRLRLVSRALTREEIVSKSLQSFLDDLLETAELARTLEGWESAGLAAVQVRNPIRMFVEHDFKNNVWEVYINPELELLGQATAQHEESCLSIPGVLEPVTRYKRIRLTYLDRDGKTHVVQVDGFSARVIQHEFDHLNGILFTDLVSSR